jgi:hypothetical protein
MKRIVKLITILSLFAQVSQAQTIKTVEEYEAFYDSIVPRLKLAEKEARNCIDKPFSEFVKLLDKFGVKIIDANMEYDYEKIHPQNVFGLRLFFARYTISNFANDRGMFVPIIYVYFKEPKPFEKAFELSVKSDRLFSEEMQAFYSDAIIASIRFIALENSVYRESTKANKGS